MIEGEVDHNHASAFALMDIERDEGKTLACCATLESDVVVEAEVDEDSDALSLPISDFLGTVSRLEDLTPTIKGIWIAPAGEGVEFQVGQYINLEIPGLDQPRAFSIASRPSERNEIELNVRRVEGGAGTAYLHEALKPGDELSFTAPLGRFFVRKSASEPLIFLAGGSGLSSPKSMILDLLDAGDERAITLIYGARSKAELYYSDLFTELAERCPNFEFLAGLSEPEEGDTWDGPRCFVHELAEQRFDRQFGGHKAYLCGPPPMVDACITSLMQGRLFEDHIFMENFFTAADGEGSARRSALFKKF